CPSLDGRAGCCYPLSQTIAWRWQAAAEMCAARPGAGRAARLGWPYRERVADRDLAALDHLGVDAHQVVAETALQRADDVEVAFGGRRVDLRRGAAGDRGDDPQPRPADRD